MPAWPGPAGIRGRARPRRARWRHPGSTFPAGGRAGRHRAGWRAGAREPRAGAACPRRMPRFSWGPGVKSAVNGAGPSINLPRLSAVMVDKLVVSDAMQPGGEFHTARGDTCPPCRPYREERCPGPGRRCRPWTRSDETQVVDGWHPGGAEQAGEKPAHRLRGFGAPSSSSPGDDKPASAVLLRRFVVLRAWRRGVLQRVTCPSWSLSSASSRSMRLPYSSAETVPSPSASRRSNLRCRRSPILS